MGRPKLTDEERKRRYREQRRRYRETHKEQIREYRKRYNQTHKEQINEYNRNYRKTEKGRKMVLACQTRYNRLHKDKVNEANRKNRERNREHYNEYMRLYMRQYRANNVNNIRDKEIEYRKSRKSKQMALNNKVIELEQQVDNLRNNLAKQTRLKKKYKQNAQSWKERYNLLKKEFREWEKKQ